MGAAQGHYLSDKMFPLPSMRKVTTRAQSRLARRQLRRVVRSMLTSRSLPKHMDASARHTRSWATYPKAIINYQKSLTEHRTPETLAKFKAAERAQIKAEKDAYINPEEAEKARAAWC